MNSESSIAWGNLVIFLVILAFVILGLSGFSWAGYAFIFTLYTYFILCLTQRKISLKKSATTIYRLSSGLDASLLIIRGARAVMLASLLIIVLTAILVLFDTNIMDVFIVPNTVFQYKIDFQSLLTGLPIGIVVGYFYSKFTGYWEKISLEKYNSQITGN